MFLAGFLAAFCLYATEIAPAIGERGDAWRHVKVGNMNFEKISICELTAELSDRADFPIHLICTNWATPEVLQFRLSKDATLGHAFDEIRKSIPKLTVRLAGSGLIWNSLGDAPYTKALDRKLNLKAVSGTLDEVMDEVFGTDYQVAGSFNLPNSRVNGDTLHIHLRSSPSITRLESLVVAAENAEARITLLVRVAEDLTARDTRPTLTCVAGDFSPHKKRKSQ